jgi:RNA polymerase sigma-70 factor, ECF subfamily
MGDSLPTDDPIQQAVNEYSTMLFRIAITHVANRQDAEDIVQSAFLKYMEKMPAFASAEHEKAWLIRVVINLCKNHTHTARFRLTVELDDSVASPAVTEDERDERDLVAAVWRLPAKYRLVIYLFYYEDCSNQAIARLCGLKETTVRSRLSRARNLLKMWLGEECQDEY